MYDAPFTCIVFHQGGTGINPVSVVHVDHTIDRLDLGRMYVPADHPIEAAFTAVGGQIRFKLIDEIHGLLHPVFEELGHRPVTKTHAMAHAVEMRVEPQHQIVSTISQDAQPAMYPADTVEEVAVRDQPAPALCICVLPLIGYLDVAKVEIVVQIRPQELVVVAQDPHDLRVVAGFLEYLLYHA